MKKITCIFVAAILIGNLSIFLGSCNNKKDVQKEIDELKSTDSINSANEQAAQTAAAEEREKRQTSDLAILGLHGPVKSLTISGTNRSKLVYEFDENGTMTSATEDGKKKEIKRGGDNKIEKIGIYTYVRDKNDFVTAVIEPSGGKYTYTVDEEGLPTTCKYKSQDFYSKSRFKIKDRDDRGNATNIVEDCYESDVPIDGLFPMQRTITYY